MENNYNLHAGNIRHAVHANKSLIMHEGLNNGK